MEQLQNRECVFDTNISAGEERCDNGTMPVNLSVYLKKWFSSRKRERRTRTYFVFFIALSLMICSFADVYSHKNAVTSDKMYHVNSLHVVTSGGVRWSDICPSDEEILETVLNYNESCPTGIEYTPEQFTYELPDYEMFLNVLPMQETACWLSDKMAYGSYFTEAKQIILSAEMAELMAGDRPETLIGKTLKKNIYGLGNVELEIVGIMEQLNQAEMAYLRSIGVDCTLDDAESLRQLYFVNSSLLAELEDDDSFFDDSSFMGDSRQRRSYQIYFGSYREAKQYEKKYGQAVNHDGNEMKMNGGMSIELELIWPLLSGVSLPLSALILVFSVLFYAQYRKTEFIYNQYFVSVFEYAGHSKRRVINQLVQLNMLELFKMVVIASAAAGAVTLTVNGLNHHFYWVPYEIFTYNPWILGTYDCMLFLLSAVSMNINLRCVRTKTWYENLINSRDLL